MPAVGELMAAPLDAALSSSGGRYRLLVGRVVFTTSGAVDTTNSISPSGVTPSKPSGTGLYRLTFPVCKNVFCVGLVVRDESGGIDSAVGKTASATAGTYDFTTHTQGATDATANATSGDSVDYCLICEI